jgi:Sec-independent protein translocase protein TatA
VYGVILLLVVIFAPKGIRGLFSALAAFIRSRGGGERVEETEEMAEETEQA